MQQGHHDACNPKEQQKFGDSLNKMVIAGC
jgi:hypothetical protein